MEEVDKIIMQTLKQLGCNTETDNEGDQLLEHFTPDQIVIGVSRCLEEINLEQQQLRHIPKSLPINMAQRFAVATSLAELCISVGYRSDIGYQTFLYPNVIEVRRLFMFLIECLPKEQETNMMNKNEESNSDYYSILMKEIKRKLNQQIKASWLPQHCRYFAANRELWGDCISLNVPFEPLQDLTLPTKEHSLSLDNSTKYQWPSIFQQINNSKYDLISSVLHRNALDAYEANPLKNEQLSSRNLNVFNMKQTLNTRSLTFNYTRTQEDTDMVESLDMVTKTSQEIEALKLKNENILKQCDDITRKLSDYNRQISDLTRVKTQLTEEVQFHERCSLILQNPEENIKKLEGLIQKTKTRRQTLETKWQQHKDATLRRLTELETVKKNKHLEQLDRTIKHYENELRGKTILQNELNKEMKTKSQDVTIANRNEYTRRIHELIGSIKKQGNDINKIINDTRELQKELNVVTGQLQRQFNYTDDLLFQSAKYELHAKQAYKLLATLHASCNEIYTLVEKSGQTSKQLQDLEVKINYERMRNVAANLKQISIDVQNIQSAIRNMETEIEAATEKTKND